MLFTLLALGLGVAIALATGGRFHHLAGRNFRLWLLLPLAIVLQFGLESDGVPAPFALLVVSYVLLLVFGLANLRHRGMWMVVLGFMLNGVVITANHGMPVRQSALTAIKFRGEIHEVKRHRQKPSDTLTVLGDIIPVPPLDTILSFGDMILAVGVMNLLYNVMRPTRGEHAIDATDPTDEPVEPDPEPADEGDPFDLDRLLPQGEWS
ncbi:MAG: hypothetical protein JWO37_2579 [Acidimicrobiales bacterium]|jgi:hypothetical protein|nr:hypothetical protein [Acidimicrobiales bacterium]